MSPFETYILRVTEYDFEQDGEQYVPSAREIEYMYAPFAVQALDKEGAMNEVSNRVGWCIKSCEFLREAVETNVFDIGDSL